MTDLGPCSICDSAIGTGEAYVALATDDRADPSHPDSDRYIPEDEHLDWTPTAVAHPSCYGQREGVHKILLLVDHSNRRLRRQRSG